jgi:hypothetical protein
MGFLRFRPKRLADPDGEFQTLEELPAQQGVRHHTSDILVFPPRTVNP